MKEDVNNENMFKRLYISKDITNTLQKVKYSTFFVWGRNEEEKNQFLKIMCNLIRKEKSRINILYTKGEELVNEMINAEKNNNLPKFHKKYKNIDILILDNVQYIIHYKWIQYELNNLMKYYYNQDKQIRVIILGNNLPYYLWLPYMSELKKIEISSITAYEDRLKFLYECLEYINSYRTQKLELTNEILELIAKRIKTNYTDLDHVLSILYIAFQRGKKITIEYTEEIVDEYINENEKFNCIVRGVEKYFNIDENYNLQYLIYGCDERVKYARKLSMYLCYKFVKIMYSYKAEKFNIGTSVFVHFCYNFEQCIEDKTDIKNDIMAIIDMLNL